ncbi:MAG: TetR family transcriptional regulator [Amycolatopsis sp.]|jgi:AcrR family transcriptional regulator|uniref:TetR/AcrR family transcriptional regulator n=1 Tax=Amycolatopsis sp. TaxID=37632 RepID=UPI00260DA35B|nr:TetR family transcriptional regulator [Amycolatopsis sp.]MCU1683702.1 TetR family transcriptional regulator [Amycolatopsis sp.]
MAQAGRRPGQSETRKKLLDAARHRFAEHGYDGATVRAIAADAGVNAAMLHHFFGTKEQLFVAAMNLPVNPGDVIPDLLAGPADSIGERLVRLFLSVWNTQESRTPFLAMIRSATTNEQAATMMRQFLDRTLFTKVAEAGGIPKARVAAAAAQMIGIALLRYIVRVPPLADASDDEIVALFAPGIQLYFDGGR